MRFAPLAMLAAAGAVFAEDLLFIDSLEFTEYTEATTKLGYSVKVVTETEWKAMTTADFAKYKAIVLADPDCGGDPSSVQFAVDTKDVWSPAVTGNIVLIGTDPTFHSSSEAGAVTLIDNSIKFAASGAGGTGLYFALSCYYNTVDSATVDALAGFGTFTVRGNLNCYNDVHIVASSPAIATLGDADLSNWSCSVHEAFSSYPTSGTGGFQSLAIAKDIMGVGSQSYGDGTSGLPYIISRGAIPAGCGNGKYEPAFAEECDDGSKNGTPGDLCSSSCKCLYGVADASAGTCKSAPPSASGTGTGGGGRTNSTTSCPYPITSSTTTTSSPSSSPTCDNTIVGIEIIVVTDIVEVCPEGSTVTETVTSTLSTLQRPIYPCSTTGYPCYVCEFGSPSTTDFMTVTTYVCPTSPAATPTVTVKMCSTCSASTVTTTIEGCTPSASCTDCVTYVSESPHVHSSAQATTTVAAVYTATATLTGATVVAPTTKPAFVTAGAGAIEVGVGGVVMGGLMAVAALI